MNQESSLNMLSLRCLGDIQVEYQVCRLIISLELKDVRTEDTNLSAYLKPGESMRVDVAREKVDLRW